MKIKFENWSFENYLKIGVLKIKFGKKTGVLKIIWKLEFWKLKFENWNFENYLKIGVLNITFEKKNWSFENYLEIEVFET